MLPRQTDMHSRQTSPSADCTVPFLLLPTPSYTPTPSHPPAPDIMCVAMNRSLANVILGGYGTPTGKSAAAVQVRSLAHGEIG